MQGHCRSDPLTYLCRCTHLQPHQYPLFVVIGVHATFLLVVLCKPVALLFMSQTHRRALLCIYIYTGLGFPPEFINWHILRIYTEVHSTNHWCICTKQKCVHSYMVLNFHNISVCRFSRNLAVYATMPRRSWRAEKRDSGFHSEVGPHLLSSLSLFSPLPLVSYL